MHYYKIQEGLQEFAAGEEPVAGEVHVAVYSFGELDELAEEEREAVLRLRGPRYCKADVYPEQIMGTLAIPKKSYDRNYHRLAFCIRRDSIQFFDDTDYTKRIIEDLKEKWQGSRIDYFFYYFLSQLIENDVEFLDELETVTDEMEEKAMAAQLPKADHQPMEIMKKAHALHRYYAQLSEIGSKMQENEDGFFQKEAIGMFRIFNERCARLAEEAQMIREYALQIQEIYQTQIDVRQNKSMAVLTVVTTIFMPLTVIAGWYGMNFSNMPELRGENSYFIVCGISAFVVIVCFLILKKKKFF